MKNQAIKIVEQLPDNFESLVLKNHETMGMDGALYFFIGTYTEIDPDDDDLLEAFLDAIIEKFPSLEF